MACTGVASAAPSGVLATDPGAVSATPVDPGMVASAAPYDPGLYGGYGGPGGHFPRHHGRGGPMMEGAMPGPPSAHVAYPYYTTRGPRDFLINNPPSIGY